MNILTVKRNKENIFRIGDVIMYPGISEIKGEANIKMVQEHKTYKELVANGVHEEITAKPKTPIVDDEGNTTGDDITSDIVDMVAAQAIPVIRGTYAIPVLEDMHTREISKKARATVLAAIKDQIAEIKDGSGSED